jgi:hypothetical protein
LNGKGSRKTRWTKVGQKTLNVATIVADDLEAIAQALYSSLASPEPKTPLLARPRGRAVLLFADPCAAARDFQFDDDR